MINKENLIKRMESYALTSYGKKIEQCNDREKYVSLSKALMEDIVPEWIKSENKFEDKKRAYYLSAEFLMGRALSNNLTNKICRALCFDAYAAAAEWVRNCGRFAECGRRGIGR